MTPVPQLGALSPRRRRAAWLVGGVTVLIAGALAVLAATFSPGWFLTPRHGFDLTRLPSAPDYSEDTAWLALPSDERNAGLSLAGDLPAGADAAADVFYVHPTTYFRGASWNATVGDPVVAELLEQVVLASEASPFNGCCRVFAPRYRQATLGTYYADPSDARAAFDLAYQDVQAAFDAFMARIGDRPYVLVGHSQGSMHLMRLLERIDGNASLRRRLVAAYLPGIALPVSYYREVWRHLLPCDGPEQVGCVAAWDLYRVGARVSGTEPLFHWRGDRVIRVPVEAPRQCTNPVTWRNGGASSADQHRGAAAPLHRGTPPHPLELLLAEEPLGMVVLGLADLRDIRVDARCVDGVLRVPDLAALGFPERKTVPGNYHSHDIELFHADVRANASIRVAAYLRQLH
ncbi:MAG: DUF3089 domain-containing protein [Myxococcales bacterium FL481]|nr:MAG: DUF3089 domain-containing protein [Myxococcales bacterium FL481]